MVLEYYSGSQYVGAKLHGTRGEEPRSSTKVPKSWLSVKGGGVSQTARRLA